MSSNLHTLTVAHNESQLVVLWSQQLQNLCRVLNAAAKSGRKFTNERYAHFLEDLRRIGIIYDKNSNVFVFQPTAAEWCELAVDESASERERQDAIKARFTFYQDFPAADPGLIFNDCANDEDERALTAAMVYLKNFQHEYEQPLIDTHKYNPVGAKAAGSARTLLSTVEHIAAYQEKLKYQQSEAKTLEGKLKVQQKLITLIKQDLEHFEPSLRLKVESALSTIENTLIRVKDLPAIIPTPLLDNIDKLSSVLVDLMEKQDDVSLINVSMIAITLEEEVLKAQKKPVEETRDEIMAENRSLTEDLRQHTDSLQKIAQTISEIESRSTLRQKLDELPQEITELSEKEVKAQEAWVKAESDVNAAQTNYKEAIEKRDACYNQIDAIGKEIAGIDTSRKDISFSMDKRKLEINTISSELGRAKGKKAVLNPQSHEEAKKELQTKIDALIKSHPFLDNSFWGTVWLFRGARKSAAHKYLAGKLASIKSELKKAKTHEEILIQAAALNDAIDQAQSIPSQEGGWEKNDNRTHRLETVQKQYTSYKEKRVTVEAVEKEIEKLADAEQSLQKQQTQDDKVIERLNKEKCQKEAAISKLQQRDETLKTKVRDAFSALEEASKSKTTAEKTLHQIRATVSEKKAELSQIQGTLATLPDPKADDTTLAQARTQGAEIQNLLQGLPEKIALNEQKIAKSQAEITEIDSRIQVCRSKIDDLEKAKAALAEGKIPAAVRSSAVLAAAPQPFVERKKPSSPKKKSAKIANPEEESSHGKMQKATQEARDRLKPSVPPVPLDTDLSHNPYGQFHHHETGDSAKLVERKLVQPVGGPS